MFSRGSPLTKLRVVRRRGAATGGSDHPGSDRNNRRHIVSKAEMACQRQTSNVFQSKYVYFIYYYYENKILLKHYVQNYYKLL